MRYNYSDDSEVEELLMEADVIPKKKGILLAFLPNELNYQVKRQGTQCSSIV